jgi:hypothetical protein
MSAAVAFSALTHRPTSRVTGTGAANVSGADQGDNVIFVNFLPASSSSSASSSAPASRLRLTRRGRRVIVGLVALPIVIAGFAMALNGGGAVATDSGSSTTFSYVTVEAGQSLWQLAQTLAPTADPRDVIAEIVSLNQIKGEIQPGQRLAIPAGY